MSLVVDASVAIKWFVREGLHEEASALLEHQAPLYAPDLIVSEVTNVAWKKVTRGDIEPDQARDIARAIRGGVPALYPSAELNARALEIALALDHPVYDCLYVACAQITETVLVTADMRLCGAAAAGPYAGFIRHLSDVAR